MARKPIYWVLLIVLSLGGTFFAYHFFPAAFPLVNLDLKMNREQAIQTAEKLAETNAWGPSEYRVAASFDLDDAVQNFVELEAGGRDAFKAMLTGDRYSPYRWVVRHFKEGEKNETIIRFTPTGDAYGFREKLAESAPGAHLPQDSALVIAQTGAAQWSVDLSAYKLVEKSQKVLSLFNFSHSVYGTVAKASVAINTGVEDNLDVLIDQIRAIGSDGEFIKTDDECKQLLLNNYVNKCKKKTAFGYMS